MPFGNGGDCMPCIPLGTELNPVKSANELKSVPSVLPTLKSDCQPAGAIAGDELWLFVDVIGLYALWPGVSRAIGDDSCPFIVD